MKLKYHLTNRMVLIALWLLVQSQSSASSFKITRGEHDMVWYGKNYREMVNRTDIRTMNCNDSREGCECNSKDGYNTVIYNTSTKFVRCVKDEDKVIGIIGNDGKYITNGNEECLGVKGRRIEAVRCSKNEISLRWLWIGIGHIMNLKTLKCLQWNNTSKEFTTEQCKSVEVTQQWTWKDGRVRLNNGAFKPEPLYVNNTIRISSYQGCYRVSGDKMIAVVKRPTKCKGKHQRNCNIEISINAPLFSTQSPKCNILWESSTYSIFNQTWKPFRLMNHGLFDLDAIDGETITLKIINNKKFFERWSGTLIKLGTQCGNENNCVLLKIESARETETPNTVTTASPFTTSSSTSFEKSTSSTTEKSLQMSSMLFIVPVVVLFCLLIAAFVVVIYYRRRQKRLKSDKDDHFCEETTSSNSMTGYEDPAQLTEMQKRTPRPYVPPGMNISNPLVGYEDPAQMQHLTPRPYETPGMNISNPLVGYEDPAQMQHLTPRPYETPGMNISNPLMGYEDPAQMQQLTPNPYESPGVSIHVGNHYEYPTNNPSPQNTLQNHLNNNFQYDYATREETSLLPLIRNGDVIFEEDISEPSRPREKRHAHAGQSSEKPLYHTLEEDASGTIDTTSGSAKSCVRRDSLAGQSSEKPFYHTLEKDTSDVSYPREELDAHAKHSREQSFYHTLENDHQDT